MSKVGKAAVLERFNAPLVMSEYPAPEDLEPGAVLVRTEMAGICGTDVHLWKGELPIQLPVILGHETVGVIEGLGEGVTKDWTGAPIEPGDRVTWNSTRSCGRCYYCEKTKQPTRCPERRAYGIGYRSDAAPHFLGGYAEYHYLKPGATLFKLAEDLPTDAVIGAGCALITAIHGIERASGPGGSAKRDELGMPMLPDLHKETVVIQGAGPVGIAAAAVAKNGGAERVILIGGPKTRLDLAGQFGADEVISMDEMSSAEERIGAVKALTNGYGADFVVECVGAPPAVVEGMELCRDGGRYLVLGQYCNAGPVSLNPHVITRKQLELYGSWSSEPRHLQAALQLSRGRRERFAFERMVSHRFKLEEANEALAATARWEATKSVIQPQR